MTETDAQRAYRLLDDYDETSEYAEGYGDGYLAAMRAMTLSYILSTKIPYAIRSKYYALRRRLFYTDDIPF